MLADRPATFNYFVYFWLFFLENLRIFLIFKSWCLAPFRFRTERERESKVLRILRALETPKISPQRSPETPRDTQRNQEKPRETKRDPEKPRETHRDPKRHREATRDQETHRKTKRNPDRPRDTQRDLEKPRETKRNQERDTTKK